MDVFCFIAAFLLVNRLKKSLKFSILYPKWQKVLSFAPVAVGILYAISFQFEDPFGDLIGSVLLLALLYYVDKQPDFESQKPYLIANLPLVAVSLINVGVEFIAPDFHDTHSNYFSLATVAAFAWIFGRWATSKKQEEALRISTERRAELEALVAERTLALLPVF